MQAGLSVRSQSHKQPAVVDCLTGDCTAVPNRLGEGAWSLFPGPRTSEAPCNKSNLG